jgi:XRE family transcriptional regulator, regulator of sulfur utilization
MARIEQKTRKVLGKRIKRLRKQQGLTQEDLAETVGLSSTYVGHIEQGRKSPSLEAITRIAKVLKVKIGELFS